LFLVSSVVSVHLPFCIDSREYANFEQEKRLVTALGSPPFLRRKSPY